MKKRIIIFIHGMWGGAHNWENFKNFFLSNGYECIAINLPGHHDGRNCEKTSVMDYVKYMETLIDGIGQEIFLVGHSMGGLITQFLTHNPAVKKAALLSTAAPRGIRFLSPSLMWAAKKYLWKILRGKPFKPTWYDYFKFVGNNIPTWDRETTYKKVVPESGKAAREVMFWQTPPIEKLGCPAKIFCGDEDRITPDWSQKKIAKKYEIKAKVFVHRGHKLMVEPGWKEVAEAIQEFFES